MRERKDIDFYEANVKHNPESKWLITLHYLDCIEKIIHWDIDNPVFEAYKKHIKFKRYNKDYVLLLFSDLPFISMEDFYQPNVCGHGLGSVVKKYGKQMGWKQSTQAQRFLKKHCPYKFET